MSISRLWRYPVKSMLGEIVDSLAVDECGVRGDRRLALVDVETGRVATAKHPRLWRSLLKFAASGDPGDVRVQCSVDCSRVSSACMSRRISGSSAEYGSSISSTSVSLASADRKSVV